jgi:peptidoglycan/LPS O-acetylase OafA/YrhL
MFFALSGFLVTGSALRLRTVGKFMSARLFRLVPALCVEVTLSALVLGPIYTGYPLTAYFTDPVFYRYFLNMFGFITFELPGVFVDNPWPRIVNINLWTLPSEFYCYLFMCAALVSKLVMHRAWYSWAFAACFVVLVLLNAFDMIVSGFVGVAVEVLIYSFFVGVLFFMWRERIVYSWPLFLLCSLLTYAAIYPVVYPNDLRQRLCRAHQAPADPASDLGRLLVWPVPLRLSDLAGADGLVARISRASVPVRCPHAAAGDRVRRVLLACD